MHINGAMIDHVKEVSRLWKKNLFSVASVYLLIGWFVWKQYFFTLFTTFLSCFRSNLVIYEIEVLLNSSSNFSASDYPKFYHLLHYLFTELNHCTIPTETVDCSAFAEKVRILTFCVKLVIKKSAFGMWRQNFMF